MNISYHVKVEIVSLSAPIHIHTVSPTTRYFQRQPGRWALKQFISQSRRFQYLNGILSYTGQVFEVQNVLFLIAKMTAIPSRSASLDMNTHTHAKKKMRWFIATNVEPYGKKKLTILLISPVSFFLKISLNPPN